MLASRVKSFKGGVHPKGNKEMSRECPVEKLSPKGEISYLMSQHIGAPAQPCVAVGQRVLVGETIGKAPSFVSADICSSVSGTVKSIKPVPTSSGDDVTAITIENDYEYEAVEGLGEPRDYENLTKDEIREAIRSAGLVGMGGAGFPLSVKLAVKDDTKIDYVIVNGAECEPYITCDYRLMIERPEKAVLGLKVVLKLFDNAKGVFAVENNKPEAIEALAKATEGSERMIVQPLKTKYPQGGERLIIEAVTGRQINSKMLPADAGCVVINLSTIMAAADAVCSRTPLMTRVVTVTGDAIVNPSNFEVPIGICARELVEAAGGFKQEPEKIIFGGPMMGPSIIDLDVPITKTTSCILCLTHDEVKNLEATACIRCGRCMDACPENLMPLKLKDLADKRKYEEFEKLGGLECISCGSCTYICPAKRRLSQSITAAKREVTQRKKAKK
ncbi:MAG: electron transport complex subunit RsxC [Oscillospiraceae bacterium]|nr:electron transport complex subunit RsxC [Oscillospiraceae bacterium]